MRIILNFLLLGIAQLLLMIGVHCDSYLFSNSFSRVKTREKQKKSMCNFFSRAPPKCWRVRDVR